jgi:hypothetical protein
MTNRLNNLVIVGLVAGLTACGGAGRNQQAYAADASRLLETRRPDLVRCYDHALEADATAAGRVTVEFVVEPDTGVIKHATIDSANTTAPDELDQCVLHAVLGLTLAPPDRNEGRATFVYEFKPPRRRAASQASS